MFPLPYVFRSLLYHEAKVILAAHFFHSFMEPRLQIAIPANYAGVLDIK